jgi:hypothetical protein
MASSAHHARMILKEVAMAAIAFKTGHLSEQAGEGLTALLAERSSTAATEQDGDRPKIVPSDQPATITAQFRPLDPGIVNETIPAFFIGRNQEGFWVARDVNGRIGGIFLLEDSAVSFARRQSGPTACATIFPSERFELDLENSGNPLVTHFGPLVRLWQRLATLLGK